MLGQSVIDGLDPVGGRLSRHRLPEVRPEGVKSIEVPNRLKEVEPEVRQGIDCCGKEGGLILCPSNTITPDVPLENILALYATAKGTSLQPSYD